jgi:structure-specific endonuclease subunit SLX1
MSAPIPSFYCCYLLRSTTKPKATPYIGSTPNILRRWKQHNGMLPGGAVVTSREGLQPWEVLCLIHGFTSRNAALQFEWAWQHPHSTRHMVNPETSDAVQRNVGEGFEKGGGRRDHPLRRQPATMARRLSHLYTLLCTPSFSNWPLHITFFANDAHQAWLLHDSRQQPSHLRPTVSITTDFRKETLAPKTPRLASASPTKPDKGSQSKSPTKKKTRLNFPVPVVLVDWDVKYERLKGQLQTGLALFEAGRDVTCDVCHGRLNSAKELVIICPESACSAASHLTCLATSPAASSNNQIIPRETSCPSCFTSVPWTSLVTELSLRAYHPQLVKTILAKGRKNGVSGSQMLPEEEEAEVDFDDDDFWAAERDDSGEYSLSDGESNQADYIDEFADIDDLPSYTPLSTQQSVTDKTRHATAIPDTIVISDSDWDDVQVLE